MSEKVCSYLFIFLLKMSHPIFVDLENVEMEALDDHPAPQAMEAAVPTVVDDEHLGMSPHISVSK